MPIKYLQKSNCQTTGSWSGRRWIWKAEPSLLIISCEGGIILSLAMVVEI